MLGNWIKQTTTTAGTGNLTLASVTGFDTFDSQFGDAGAPPYTEFVYVITDGNNWETGRGHMSTSTVLVRDRVDVTLNAGTLTRSGAALTLSGATATVFCDMTVDYMESPAIYKQTSTTGLGGVSPGQHSTSSTGAQLANTLLWYPFRHPMSGVYSGINWHFSAVAGSNFKYAIYSVGTDGNPNRVLCQTVSVTPATGDHYTAWTGGNTYLERGDYYLCYQADGISSTYVDNIYGNYPGTPVAGVDANGSVISRVFLGQTYGAFPDPYVDAGATHDLHSGTPVRPYFSLARTV